MRGFSPISVFTTLILASSAMAQRYTTTLPWADGNTIVYSLSTDPIAGVETVTLSIVAATGAVTTPTTTNTRTTARTTATTAAVTTTDADGNVFTTTTGQRVVGQQESMAPMQTTTYWYDPGNGVWTSAVWTASVTAAPTVVTANVPEGTIAAYETYQQAVNSKVLASAEAAVNNSTGAADRMVEGWSKTLVGLAVGAAGVGALAVGL